MLAMKSFFKDTFFISGTEGNILFAMCIVAIVLTLAAIALVITVIVTLKRRKSEGESEVPAVKEEQTPAMQADQAEIEQTPAEEGADVSSAVSVQSVVSYNKSFTAKLIQTEDEVKWWYGRLKNELLSYKKVKSRVSWKRESFYLGRNIVARLSFRGETLCVYLALNPNEFEGSKYKIESFDDIASYADTPCLYRMKNERRVRYATELIAMVMENIGAARNEEYVSENFYLPAEDTGALIEKGLIKLVNTTRQIISQDADEDISDDEPTETPADETQDEDTEE